MAFFWAFINTILQLLSTSLFSAVFSVVFVVIAICYGFTCISDIVKR